jgi:uncharacterized protein YcbK (DUF882 family)
VAVCTGRSTGFGLSSSGAGRIVGLAAILAVAGYFGLQDADAIGDTRTISLHHVHTNEDITVTYKRNGLYDEAALQKLNWFLRDWRRNEQIKMNPQLIDLLWEVHREVKATAPINVVCGYRAPETNAMLRARSNGVALYSQHMSGNATDFFIPGVPIENLRVTALRLQDGGVGYYPTSGSPFVHVDTGNVRHWPRMTREELVRVFPNQRTVHIPSDGQPLAGYALALADIERGVKPAQSKLKVLAMASDAHEDEEIATGSTQRPMLAARTGSMITAAMTKPAPQVPVQRVAAKTPAEPFRTVQVASAATTATPAGVYLPWPTAQEVDRVSPEIALAYAAQNEPAPRRPLADVQRAIAVPPVAPKRPMPAAQDIAARVQLVPANPRLDNPWLRAVVLAPSMYHFMSSTQLNPTDSRLLSALIQKPRSALMMTFSADPYNGMTSHAFSGKAVMFMATVNFGMRTAALR